MCGQLLVGKGFLIFFTPLVGAAMCAASHEVFAVKRRLVIIMLSADRVPVKCARSLSAYTAIGCDAR